MTDDRFTIHTTGGPHDGRSEVVATSVIKWPPPVNLPGVFHGGFYVLTTFESNGQEREARYEWRAGRRS